jgi:diaminopimelate epimerase
MEFEFWKMHGAGNDFVVLDRRNGPHDEDLPAAAARALCDRHTGVGADGVLLVLPGDSDGVRMVVYNADGSRPEMCGNGLRCVARHVAGREQRAFVIHTDAGPTEARVTAASVEVSLARPRPGPRATLTALDQTFTGIHVDAGNPHFVIEGDFDEADARRYGPVLELDPAFPHRANISFATVREDGSVRLFVWERGCGLTQACGSGACATAAAMASHGAVEMRRLDLPGGRLSVRLTPHAAWLGGPAERVFRGVVVV